MAESHPADQTDEQQRQWIAAAFSCSGCPAHIFQTWRHFKPTTRESLNDSPVFACFDLSAEETPYCQICDHSIWAPSFASPQIPHQPLQRLSYQQGIHGGKSEDIPYRNEGTLLPLQFRPTQYIELY